MNHSTNKQNDKLDVEIQTCNKTESHGKHGVSKTGDGESKMHIQHSLSMSSYKIVTQISKCLNIYHFISMH